MVSNRQVGISLIMVAIALLFIVISFTNELKSMETCPMEQEGFCPHAQNIPPQTFAASIIIVILVVIGLFLFKRPKETQVKKVDWKKNLKGLSSEEQGIYKSIADSDGVIFQSELIDKMKLSKVKITRILDKLEAKGLVERRRRGMSNVVVIKKQ